ncbi:uncharacterized protein [Typha latifolia]|uniref:uncharacterized protein n=1 Tax=Typha latifolia TaxID=4733 RepID=UPI003C306F22
MSDPYKKAKAGRLTFKGGDAATLEKKKKRKKKKVAETAAEDEINPSEGVAAASDADDAAAGGDVYTIDAAKRMKYEELFPVETKKFGYDPANKSRVAARSVEEALDDRVRKKADRYCK